jgi:hypothetical protein
VPKDFFIVGDGTGEVNYGGSLLTPREILPGTTFTQFDQFYALKSTGELMIWGYSPIEVINRLQASAPYTMMEEISGSGWNNWTYINRNGNFSHIGCGLRGTGVAYCFGDNTNWAGIGKGGDTSCGNIQVAGGISNFKLITSDGYRSSCGITTTGDLYCWGQNISGQFGTASVPVDATLRPPTLITLPAGVKAKTD